MMFFEKLKGSQLGLPSLVLAIAVSLVASAAYAGAGKEWTVSRGDAAGTGYSTLDQINTGNVSNLKVKWMHSMGSVLSQETAPLIIDGVMYFSTSSGPAYVFAVNAETGETIWAHQPDMPPDYHSVVCCGEANRGVTYANGRIFFGRLDAILVALDAKTGEELWQTEVRPYKDGYSITVPPITVGDKVIVGHSGGEFGVRGSVQAYDQASGELIWRFYTIPGPGEQGHETWKGDSWQTGGGTAWLYFTHDPDLNLIYFGTSNGAPWGGQTRGNDSSDIGIYTNWGTAAHIALNPDTGELVWHYQMTPSDVWDYDGVNEGVLVDLNIGGSDVPALLKADRNGFFYVLNRTNGDVISAEPISVTNWATKVDKETGRPVEAAGNEFRPQLDKWARGVCPNLIGGKNWQPMSYSEQTGLVYVPTFNLCMDITNREQKYVKGTFYLASEFDLAIATPGFEDALGEYKAWDPVNQKLVWSIKEELPFLGGALTTAGGLLFYGNQSGVLKAVDASNGDILWSFKAGSGISAPPVTYEIGGKQYITVVSGRLVGPPSFFGAIGQRVIDASPTGGMLITFELGS